MQREQPRGHEGCEVVLPADHPRRYAPLEGGEAGGRHARPLVGWPADGTAPTCSLPLSPCSLRPTGIARMRMVRHCTPIHVISCGTLMSIVRRCTGRQVVSIYRWWRKGEPTAVPVVACLSVRWPWCASVHYPGPCAALRICARPSAPGPARLTAVALCTRPPTTTACTRMDGGLMSATHALAGGEACMCTVFPASRQRAPTW